MELERYIEEIHGQLTVTAEASGEEARALADRLAAPLDAAIRLALRGRNPEFVVTPPPADPTADQADEDDAGPAAWPAADGDDDSIARINLRLPEYLKARIEGAAAGEGLSVNSWLVRTSAAAVERGEGSRRRERHTPPGAQRYTGWAR